MSKKKKTEIILKIDKPKLAKKLARQNIGSPKPTKIIKSFKDKKQLLQFLEEHEL